MEAYHKIAVFTFPYEYAVLKLLLEQAEIRFFFQNETVIGMLPFSSRALGGIYLKVHPDDMVNAQKIVEDFKSRSHLEVV